MLHSNHVKLSILLELDLPVNAPYFGGGEMFQVICQNPLFIHYCQ